MYGRLKCDDLIDKKLNPFSHFDCLRLNEVQDLTLKEACDANYSGDVGEKSD